MSFYFNFHEKVKTLYLNRRFWETFCENLEAAQSNPFPFSFGIRDLCLSFYFCKVAVVLYCFFFIFHRCNKYVPFYLIVFPAQKKKNSYSTGHLLWILFFFYKNCRLNQFIHLLNIFFQYTDTQVRLEHWKILNASIFS